METIAGLATGNTTAGISIIRVSGDKSLEIAKKLIHKELPWEPRQLYLTDVTDGNISDKSLVVYYKAPCSFTGEDVVEFQIHGGMALANAILTALLDRGARMCLPGEFSKRAFLNGRASLDALEGTVDIINAQSEAELKAGYNLLIGTLKNKTDAIQSKLTDTLAAIDVALDYPEEDIEYETTEHITNQIVEVQNEIQALVDSSKTGLLISNGINVAIVGKPNVGKSSLLNGLLSYERAIVTDVAGTTRDTLQETYVYEGIKVNLIDTAGIHESQDKVERIGIERSVQALNEAHLILLVIDSSRELNDEDYNIIDLCTKQTKQIIVAINKSDISKDTSKYVDKIKTLLPSAIILVTSAQDNDSIISIKKTIKSLCVNDDFNSNSLFITNTRHLTCLKSANQKLSEALAVIHDVSLDLVSIYLKDSWQDLGEITGKVITEEVLDTIFSKFCLGK